MRSEAVFPLFKISIRFREGERPDVGFQIVVLSLGDGGGRLGRRDVTGATEKRLGYGVAFVSRIVTGS